MQRNFVFRHSIASQSISVSHPNSAAKGEIYMYSNILLRHPLFYVTFRIGDIFQNVP